MTKEQAVGVKLVIALGIVLSLCNACSGRQQKQGPLVQDLLNDMPCAAPCWQRIIPGQTTRQEAIDILFADTRKSYIRDPKIYDREWDKGTIIRWWTRDVKLGSKISPRGEVRIHDDVVHCVVLGLDGGLTAQMVIDKWESPGRVATRAAGAEQVTFTALLFYPEQGLELGIDLDPHSDPLVLGPEDSVGGVSLYAPMDESQWMEEEIPKRFLGCSGKPLHDDKILDWTGFGPIDPESIEYY